MKSMGEKNRKQRILDAALEIFASKGFEGARIDEIAKTAGVNKALLYYYFESKEALLSELIEINAKDFLAQKDKFFNASVITQDTFTFEKMSNFIPAALEMLAGRKDILKIMLTGAVKSGPADTAFFDFSQSLMEDSIRRAKELGFKHLDTQYLKTAYLFMGIMPVCLFIVLGDKWAKYSGYDPENIKKMFFEIFKRVYLEMAPDLLSKK
ncbi:TetR/AcrR family transcriptional regulator [Dehalococcoidia bacterium]|nr:TetR/AcrR family transcriptional regulator [Dehalococcoidia bacterium]